MELKEIGQTITSEEIEELLNKSELTYIPITYYNYNGFFIPIGDTKEEHVYPGISVIKIAVGYIRMKYYILPLKTENLFCT